MNAIFGFLEIAQANPDDSEKVQYALRRIREASKFLKALADDVLDISLMEQGKLELRPTPACLGGVMKKFEDFAREMDADKKHRLVFDVHDILHNRIEVDVLRLHQIYSNVFSNAVKYTPAGGSITVEVYQQPLPDAKKVRIVSVITDTCIGMSEEFMEKMFTKFAREMDTRVNRIIAMTENAMQDDIRRCLDAGMDRHLAKPVDMVQLADALWELSLKENSLRP